MEDRDFIKRAINLASKARGRTSPNPMVGAVIVKNGRIIGEGYHKKAGQPHAEVIAIENAGKEARGATLYVNLEPCCHKEKRTPPCTTAIIRAGIKRVVVATIDPNPLVMGRGISELRSAGIEVDDTGIMEDEARRLNEMYIKFITEKKPFVILKIAQSIDGKIATSSGESRWITGEKARRLVHQLRNEVDAVMVGIGTVKKDDPSLDCRIKDGRNPYRIILDGNLGISLDSKVLRHGDGKTIIVTTRWVDKDRIKEIEKLQNRVIVVKDNDGLIDMIALMEELAKMNIVSVMIEGGSSVSASALSSGVIDKVVFFISPMIIGGTDSIPSIGGRSPALLRDAVKIKGLKTRMIGEDILVEGYLS